MPPPSDARPRKRRLSRRWALGWLGVFLGCAGLWACEVVLYHADWAEKRERKARSDELARLLEPYLNQPPVTVGKLEGDLNGGRPFALLSDYLGSIVHYRWDAGALGTRFAGWKVELVCGRNRAQVSRVAGLMSYKIIPPPARRDDSSPAARAEMETTRNIVLLLGGGAWFVGMVTIFFARPWRRQAAQVGLAGVLIAAVAWSVSPTRAWGQAGLVAPLPIGIASAGLLSLFALVLPVRRYEPGNPTPCCSGCAYDLTGNQSGICPECGRPTLRKRVDRWEEQAEQLRSVVGGESREGVDCQREFCEVAIPFEH